MTEPLPPAQLRAVCDPALLDRLDRAIAAGVSAPVAIDDVLGQLEKLLGAVPDAYLQERVDDIDDKGKITQPGEERPRLVDLAPPYEPLAGDRASMRRRT
mgnify:CR=1 FL=1